MTRPGIGLRGWRGVPTLAIGGDVSVEMQNAVTEFYDTHADAFIAQTRDVDMTALRQRFLDSLPRRSDAAGRLLDAGCGAGRDARAFATAGYDVSAFDASPAMVAATEDHAGVPVRRMTFEGFAWEHPFEGIWACASLLHVAEEDLLDVLSRLALHLVPDGVLYMSFKVGTGMRTKDGRRFTDMTEARLGAFLDGRPGLTEREMWRTADRRPDRSGEEWLNTLVWHA